MAVMLWPVLVAAQYRVPTVYCSTRDHNMALDLELPLRNDGSRAAAASGFAGDLEIIHQKMPADRRRWSLDKRQPAQFWLTGNDLKLRLLLGTGENLVDLVIEAQRRAANESIYAGNFRLETAEGVRVTGRMSCETN
jgi:hypothetical protein